MGERPEWDALPRITREVADEWRDEDGERLSVPPDELAPKDDRAFWAEVRRRFRERYGCDW